MIDVEVLYSKGSFVVELTRRGDLVFRVEGDPRDVHRAVGSVFGELSPFTSCVSEELRQLETVVKGGAR